MGRLHSGRPGKIAALLDFLREYADAVAADFWSHYNGLDLRDLFRHGGGQSRMTYRMADSFIARLPRSSATKTALRNAMDPQVLADLAAKPREGHEFGPISDSDWFVIAAIDRLDLIYRAVYEANGFTIGDTPPFPRPGLMPKVKGQVAPEVMEQIAQMRAEHRARQEVARAEQASKSEPVGGDVDD